MFQQTIGSRIAFDGVGVHSGLPVQLSLLPAEANTGIVFHLFDGGELLHEIKAVSANAALIDLATVVGDPRGAHVSTIEHLMASLYAMGIDNIVVQIDAHETPIMDGCAAAFIAAIREAGTVSQACRRRYLRVLKPVTVEMNGAWAEYRPHNGTRFEVEIEFDSPVIGRQTYSADLTAERFARDLSRARTFGFMKDVERLWAAGFALGSSLENSVVIGEDGRVINPEGLRYKDEFVRHKTLDAIGDQALAGARVLGCYRSYRGGHKLNALALQALLADHRAYEMIEMPSRRVDPVRHAPLVAVAAPAYGPQTL
ncbi:MAG: UDP-3-O-acyl-N-acetylglucosamine deacetylase [Aurantimonas endophytica]|uniref:UDP-3-O-acyl-N-acetylglucosamine deacetylase n=1 Tax=Aurantimonas endophytica TaxID=1522175 RepID=A0A7W6MNW2_9HYPH|nr:UDP-3-O-acyl-N-acetylglucosamine deacetylase [Aurantimonas endophytica]MBB4002300.1 UDP-3-O-[3-hydroxymyristoyl] N-acetylglucosamine deacetylase [Aurantimonas endophytica]MCO6402076.1 UDP-3-O-acyl-N-acetylglucosamine deacetylase [Aurantimonas endophytica]